MTTRQLRIGKWIVGSVFVVALTVLLRLFGYPGVASVLVAFAFAIPPTMVFYLGEKGYLPRIGKSPGKVFLAVGTLGMFLLPPMILVSALSAPVWMTAILVVWLLLDVGNIVRGVRMSRGAQAAGGQVPERS